MIATYHGFLLDGSKPSRATRMMESERVMIQRIFVKLLISSSRRPVFDREGDVDRADRVCRPVYMTTPYVVVLEAKTVFAQAVLSMVRGAEVGRLGNGC